MTNPNNTVTLAIKPPLLLSPILFLQVQSAQTITKHFGNQLRQTRASDDILDNGKGNMECQNSETKVQQAWTDPFRRYVMISQSYKIAFFCSDHKVLGQGFFGHKFLDISNREIAV